MQDLKITIIQSNLVWKNTPANLLAFDKHIETIDSASDLIVLPEMFNTGFVVEPQQIEEGAWDIALLWMQSKAKEKNLVVTGSMIVREEENYYNRLYWVHPNGGFQTYNKKHLFSLGNEHLRFTAGEKPLIVELNGWKIKPLICYDLRFPVWAKNNYHDGEYDYDLIMYVANWPAARSYAWKSLLVARAIENQAYAVGVNRIGEDAHGTKHNGFSGVIEPKGEWIGKQVKDCESVQTISLSAEDLLNYRNKFTVGLDWDGFSIHKKRTLFF